MVKRCHKPIPHRNALSGKETNAEPRAKNGSFAPRFAVGWSNLVVLLRNAVVGRRLVGKLVEKGVL
ncbi:MAG: hypothetical protein IT258_23880 [Saprospiraceae bacterium]|nr:hypothetical protein [Saprospiraceae bacterium]